MREPEIALDLNTRLVDQTISWVRRRLFRPDQRNLRPEQRRGPRPAHPLRDTVAGIVGNSISSARTLCSNSSEADGRSGVWNVGGDSDANAFNTVVREIPSCLAICAFGTPSARCNCRIKAQCSKEITRPIVE